MINIGDYVPVNIKNGVTYGVVTEIKENIARVLLTNTAIGEKTGKIFSVYCEVDLKILEDNCI